MSQPFSPSAALARARAALPGLASLTEAATEALRDRVLADGRPDSGLLEAEQHAAHALSWIATYAASLAKLAAGAGRLDEAGSLGEIEGLILEIGCGEYRSQLFGGIPRSQTEFARLSDLGLDLAP